ncbi:MAG: hypothetical protein HC896_13175 [Bacteroidales bacterium]|nr:hypothetical protein [Bacteroidales bacterium]
MAVTKAPRLSKLAREFNVGISTIVEFLHSKGHNIDSNPNNKVTPEMYAILQKEYSGDITLKKESEKVNLRSLRDKHGSITIQDIEKEEDIDDSQEADEEVIIKNFQGSGHKEVFKDTQKN